MTAETVLAIPLGAPLPYTNLDTSDTSGYVEGSLCALSENLLVFGVNSEDSFAFHFQAIDISGDAPTVGPDAVYFSFGNDWLAPPLPDDPLANVDTSMNDLSFVIATGPTTFGCIGQPAGLLTDGTYHVASFYEVDPNTLQITRTAICSIPDGLPDWFPEELNAAAWGENLVVVSDHFDAVAICQPSGAVVIHYLSSGSFSSALGPVVVVDDTAIMVGYPAGSDEAGWIAVDLNSGSVSSTGSVPGIGDGNWSHFMAAMPDGRVAITTTGDSINHLTSGLRFPVLVGILDWRANTFRSILLPDSYTDNFGFTGGWYSNIRDIEVWPDGTIVVAWPKGNSTPTHTILNDNLEILDEVYWSGDFPVKNPINNVLFWQIALPSQGRIAGIWRFPGTDDATMTTWLLLPSGLGSLSPEINADLDRIFQAFQGNP